MALGRFFLYATDETVNLFVGRRTALGVSAVDWATTTSATRRRRLLMSFPSLFTALQFRLFAELGNPLPIAMLKVFKEAWVPTAKLANNASLLDLSFAGRKGIVGNFTSVFMHEREQVTEVAGEEMVD